MSDPATRPFIKIRIGTLDQYEAQDPKLELGELAYETSDYGTFVNYKIGDGVHKYSELRYQADDEYDTIQSLDYTLNDFCEYAKQNSELTSI